MPCIHHQNQLVARLIGLEFPIAARDNTISCFIVRLIHMECVRKLQPPEYYSTLSLSQPETATTEPSELFG